MCDEVMLWSFVDVVLCEKSQFSAVPILVVALRVFQSAVTCVEIEASHTGRLFKANLGLQ